MAVVSIAEFGEEHNLEAQGPLVETDLLAGLVAMARWGRLSTEQYALARQVSYRQATADLNNFEAEGLVSAIRTRSSRYSGQGLKLYGLRTGGFRLLEEDERDLSLSKRSAKSVKLTAKFDHKYDIITALISARAHLEGKGAWIIHERAESDFHLVKGTQKPTYIDGIIPDAILQTEDGAGNQARYMIEVDRKSERIRNLRGKSIVSMCSAYWSCLEKLDDPKSFRILITVPDEKRLHAILGQVPWGSLKPIKGWTPGRAFRVSIFEQSVGEIRSGEPRKNGNFWGPVWYAPGSSEPMPLLRGAV